MVFPGGSDGKESACNARDGNSIPGWGRSPGEENDNLLKYFCLKNPMDRGAWLQRATNTFISLFKERMEAFLISNETTKGIKSNFSSDFSPEPNSGIHWLNKSD